MDDGFTVSVSDRIYVRGGWGNRALSKLWDSADWNNQNDDYWDAFWERHYRVYLREADKAIERVLHA